MDRALLGCDHLLMRNARRRACIIFACIVVVMVPVFWSFFPQVWESSTYVKYYPLGVDPDATDAENFVLLVKRWDVLPGADVIRMTYNPNTDISSRTHLRARDLGAASLADLHGMLTASLEGRGPLMPGPLPATQAK